MQIERPYRASHRLRGFDYSLPEAYYVTICASQKRCIFGAVRSGKVCLNDLGEIVREEWLRIQELRPSVRLGDFEIMPNHIHGIIIIVLGKFNATPGGLPAAPTNRHPASLGSIVGCFKGAVTRRVRKRLNQPSLQVWQRDFYDHIIRDDDDWERIRAYILDNPSNWSSDPENPLL
jgi:REP element-mobilizing transposase RayT